MTIYYKSVRLVNGKLTRTITNENDNIIRNSTDEQINTAVPDSIMQIRKNKFEGRKCCACGGTDMYVDSVGHQCWNKEHDKNSHWTGRYGN